MNESQITPDNFKIPLNIGLSEENDVPALNLMELDEFLILNKNSTHQRTIQLLKTAKKSCLNGVSRVHLVNGSIDGALPCEIFSDLGCGTMIYSQNYGTLRPMTREDVPAVLSVMRPFIQKKILLPRTDESLLESYSDFIVYEIDGGIRACASLHLYDNSQAEIAAVAVDEAFSHLGIGPSLVKSLISKAQNKNISSIFILTTQTSDWFEKLGFKKDSIDSLPEERKAIWTPERNSQVFRLTL